MLVKLEAYHDGESWCARGMGEDIFTQGESLDELVDNIKDAVVLHLEGKVEQGEAIRALILVEAEVKGELQSHKPRGRTIPLSNEEVKRRKDLMEHILKMRDELPPLGMTTAELVRLSREERKWLYES